MIPSTERPTRAGAAGDVARRLALWVGPGLAARDGSRTAALYLALGATLATARAYTAAALTDVVGLYAVGTLDLWEQSLGMLTDPGASTQARQSAVTARWRAARASAALGAITRTGAALVPTVAVLEVAMARVRGTSPAHTQHLAVLLPEADEDDPALKARLDSALAAQVPAHVSWALGRGDGPDIDPFRCDDPDSRVARDLLAS